MRVLTVYTPEDSGLIRLWEKSWRSHGWKPGLISPKELQGRSVAAAAKLRKAKRVVSVRAINFGQRPRQANYHVKRHGAPDWERARIVLFPPNMTADQILQARNA